MSGTFTSDYHAFSTETGKGQLCQHQSQGRGFLVETCYAVAVPGLSAPKDFQAYVTKQNPF